jgi:GxxExxY protein
LFTAKAQRAAEKIVYCVAEDAVLNTCIMNENLISEKIIGCAIEVHKVLGPGLLESSYVECLSWELKRCDLYVEREKPIPVIYKGVSLDCGYRADLLIEGKVLIEAKAVQILTDLHFAQVLTYLKLMDCKLGLLINFNAIRLKDGLKRVVHGL